VVLKRSCATACITLILSYDDDDADADDADAGDDDDDGDQYRPMHESTADDPNGSTYQKAIKL